MCLASHRRLLLQCITNSAREKKISSSLQLPDRVLNFLKDHFLMDGQVRSRLLLLQPQARYQRVAVHRVPGLHRTYDVLFLGTGECPQQGRPGVQGGTAVGSWAAGSSPGLSTVLAPGDGRLHKAVSVGPTVHIIEELQIFSPGQPVQNLLLDPDRVSGQKSLDSVFEVPLLPTSGPHQLFLQIQAHSVSSQKVGCLGA